MVRAGRGAEAEPILRGRIAALEAAKRDDTAEWAANAELLASVLSTSKRAADAVPLVKKALVIRERIGEPAPIGRALNVMAAVTRETGDSRGAESFARRAIALLSPIPGPEDRLVAAWGNLGMSLDRQGRLPEARAAFEEGIAAGGRRLDADAPVIAALTALREAVLDRIALNEKAVRVARGRIDEALRANGPDDPGSISDRDGLAAMLSSLGQYEEAEAQARSVYEMRSRTLPPGDGLIRSARRTLTRIQLRRLLDKIARAPAPAAIAKPPVDAARARQPDDYSEAQLETIIKAGRFADGEAILRARIAAHEAAGRAATAGALTDIELLAFLLVEARRMTEAEALMRKALRGREATGDPAMLARSLRRLAIVRNEREDYRGAEILARRAIEKGVAANIDGRAQASSWGALGRSLQGQRRRSEASAAFQRAIDLATSALGAGDAYVAELNGDLAINLEELGDPAGAETIFRRNLAAIEKAKGRNSLESALALAQLSANLNRQRKSDEALAALLETIAIREKILGLDHPSTVTSLTNLVGLLVGTFDWQSAIEVQTRVDAARALGETRGEDAVIAAGQMGRILKSQDRHAEAAGQFRHALALARQRLDPGHPFFGIAAVDLASALLAVNPKDAEALTAIREAVAGARSERARMLAGYGAERGDRALAAALGDRGQIGRGARNLYANAISILASYATQVRAEETKLRAESFMIAQDLAATDTSRALTGIAVRESLGDTPLASLVREQQALAAEIRAKDEALTAAFSGAPERAAKLRAEIDALGPRLAAADARLRNAYPDYARLVAPRPLSEADVQQRLAPGEALLLIVEGAYYTFSFVVTPRQTGWWAAATPFNEAQQSIAAIRCDVDPLTCAPGKSPSPVFDRVTSHEIYRQLIQPHEKMLDGVKTLYVATSGDLSDLPFAALITAKPEGPDTEEALLTSPWLGDRYALVSLPSVSALHAVKAGRKPGTTPFIGYGAPALAAAGTARAIPSGLAPAVSDAGTGLADPARLRALRSLPGTAIELRAMARVLGADGEAVHLGQGATEAAVRADPRIKDARIVAFATHGLLPGDLGFAEPGLVFTPPASASAADDGVLSASEAAELRLAADWVILSACNTATVGGKGGGDALSGLARAFLYAGADALLASRWRVGDQVTAALTVETLANAKRDPKAGRAAALQAAMRAVRTGRRADGSAVEGWDEGWAHPTAWAPFSLIADGN